MNRLPTEIPADTWVKATWDEYLQAIEVLDRTEKYYKSYYCDGYCRLEMTPIGFDHARDHTIVMLAIHLYCLARKLKFQGINTGSYRKTGCREVQPDASYYFAEKIDRIPRGTSIVDLDIYPPPDLVIEVSHTTLGDDLGSKRLLYEELGVSEYWVVDVRHLQVIAFVILDRGSQRIEISRVLPRLSIALIEEALQRSQESDHGTIGEWLMTCFQN